MNYTKNRPDFDDTCKCGFYWCDNCEYPWYPMEIDIQLQADGTEEENVCPRCNECSLTHKKITVEERMKDEKRAWILKQLQANNIVLGLDLLEYSETTVQLTIRDSLHGCGVYYSQFCSSKVEDIFDLDWNTCGLTKNEIVDELQQQGLLPTEDFGWDYAIPLQIVNNYVLNSPTVNGVPIRTGEDIVANCIYGYPKSNKVFGCLIPITMFGVKIVRANFYRLPDQVQKLVDDGIYNMDIWYV